jgi:hypothetical protein
MPFGSSDRPVSATNQHQVTTGERYGRTGFTAAVVNIFALEFLTWIFIVYWYLLPVIVLPAVIIDALFAFALTRRRGTAAQVGRGMLIGCISAPLTVVIFIPAWIIAQAIGPI